VKRVHLLDVNVLIALLWVSHPQHAACKSWFDHAHKSGWATCAMTEAGFARVIASPAFAEQYASVHQAISILSSAKRTHSGHEFWNSDLSIEMLAERWTPPLGNKQVTDAYLLTLAREKTGTLVTFDRGISSLAGRANFAPATLLTLGT
jgi:toxin-antitoxin system PIN domain toxin